MFDLKSRSLLFFFSTMKKQKVSDKWRGFCGLHLTSHALPPSSTLFQATFSVCWGQNQYFLTAGWMTSGQLLPFLPALAIGIALALTASLCLQHGIRPDFPTVCLWFNFTCSSNHHHSILQILSMTLVLHLALPEELTLPLVVLLACVVVLDLQIPLGPLLYFVSHIFDAKIGHGENHQPPSFVWLRQELPTPPRQNFFT